MNQHTYNTISIKEIDHKSAIVELGQKSLLKTLRQHQLTL